MMLMFLLFHLQIKIKKSPQLRTLEILIKEKQKKLKSLGHLHIPLNRSHLEK